MGSFINTSTIFLEKPLLWSKSPFWRLTVLFKEPKALVNPAVKKLLFNPLLPELEDIILIPPPPLNRQHLRGPEPDNLRNAGYGWHISDQKKKIIKDWCQLFSEWCLSRLIHDLWGSSQPPTFMPFFHPVRHQGIVCKLNSTPDAT